MENKRKSLLFTLLGGSMAAITAPIAAIPTIQHIYIVLPLVLMGFFLFAAGYYAGKFSRKK